MFSSLRAFQRYIICNFSLPFDSFSIFGFDFVENRVQQRRNNSREKEAVFMSLVGPTVNERNIMGEVL
jgi:hypothetical protein